MKSFRLNLPLPINNTHITPKQFLPSTITPSSSRIQTVLRPLRTARFPPLLASQTDTVAVTEDETDIAEPLPDGLSLELMPRHVAVIMDGNGRWAKQRGWVASKGHEVGVRSLEDVMKLCGDWGIQVLTVFAFSSDNWTRPEVEVNFLLSLFEKLLKSELDKFVRKGIRVSVIGDSSRLPRSLQRIINEVEETTKGCSKLHLLVAVSYSGKYDVLKACQNIAAQVKEGLIEPHEISEELIEQELETNCTEYSSPDLLIRTSGELRISNFLLWQLAYTELYFAEQLWPDFGKPGFVDALLSYQQRQRRYGQRT
ncbi:dehydrodolichyl diphosphate synthase 2 [Mercurialis annua]|uniref:dehydrodolichyl diphosphate synthase 2 n=1 Tax=Mercurialis annua TaxID=3986 RepID=UPI00215F9A00|nr:dehydrodolichyl diphosphate synthase 2 [Mercurialis annua]